jgi:Nucleotidyltransferase domain
MDSFTIKPTQNLADHNRVLQAILRFFSAMPEASGCFLAGSAATNTMDEDSDLDIGLVFSSAEAREATWQARWTWEIAPWFHRFDADHIKPHFVIYIFEPHIRADLSLYLPAELPPGGAGPCTIVWDHHGVLAAWIDSLPEPQKPDVPWQEAVHDDERFWAWSVYLYNHIHRGEYYHCAYEFPALRAVLERWAARLAGEPQFASRRLESAPYAKRLLAYDLFPKPDRPSLRGSLLAAIRLQLALRTEMAARFGVAWKAESRATERVASLVESL